MSIEFKNRMLKAMVSKPCTLRTFTEGSAWFTAPELHVARYAEEMAADGLIFEHEGEWHATVEGRDLLARKTTKAESVTWCSASTKGPYVTPNWNVRAGGNDHLAFRSRGLSV